MHAVNVSAPETIDANMTKSILEDHGVGAAASLVGSPHACCCSEWHKRTELCKAGLALLRRSK